MAQDESKVLDFLATHQEDLKLDHQAVFTDNFKKHTASIRSSGSNFASESDDKTEVQIRIKQERSHKMIWNMHFQSKKNHISTARGLFSLATERKSGRLQRRISEIKMLLF